MKQNNTYLKKLYKNNSLEEFLAIVEVSDLEDSRMKAIISALKRSIHVLDLEMNPIITPSNTNKPLESNSPQEQ